MNNNYYQTSLAGSLRDIHDTGEEAIFAEYCATFGDNPIVFDAGACLGAWSIMARKYLPAATIHAFDFNPCSLPYLKLNTKDLNIITNNFGLLDKNTVQKIYYAHDRNIATSKVLVNDIPGSLVTNINFIKGDEYCSQQSINHIDYLKIDTEGAEYLILCGFEDMIRNHKIGFIQFEVGNINRKNGCTTKLLSEFFTAHEYRVGNIVRKEIQWDVFGPHFASDGTNLIAKGLWVADK